MSSRTRTESFQSLIDRGWLEIGDGYRAKHSELGGTGPMFLRAGRVTDTGFKLEGCERFQSHLADKYSSKLSRPFDVLVTTKGNSTGRTAFVPATMPTVVYSPHLSYWRSLDTECLSPGFLRYWAQSREFLAQLHGLKASTDMAPYLSLQDQRLLSITVPSLAEQQAIAEVLGALDDKIALNRRMNRTLEDMAAALFRSWFVDFDPVVAKADGRAPFGMDAETAALFPDTFVESEEGPIPEGWALTSLADVGDWLSGGTPRRSRDDYWGGDIPWISAKTLTRACVIDSDRNVTPLGAENGTRVIPPGTLMFVVRGMSLAKELRFGTSDVPVAFNQDLKAIRPRAVTTGFLLAWFNAHQQDILALADAASHGTRRLQTELLEALYLVVPPIERLKALSDRFDAMLAQRFQNARQSRTLAALRDALLPQLLSGTIRLKDAERRVGEA